MKRLFANSPSGRVAGLLISAATGAALCLAASGFPANAAPADQCPRGQIFWKSKKSCVDKAEAARLGFYHGPVPADQQTGAAPVDKAGGAPAGAPDEAAAPENAAAEPPAAPPPVPPPAASPRAAKPSAAASKAPVARPVSPAPAVSTAIPAAASFAPAAAPAQPRPFLSQPPAEAGASAAPATAPSPYGELVVEEFAKVRGIDGAQSN